MGLLPQIADGVGVSIPTAGHFISAYAVGVVVGAPVIAVFGAKLPRKGLLVGLMAAYALFNVLSALATSYGVLFLARFLDGLPHGAYFGVAALVAASLAPPERRGRAVASVMLGLSVANVVGVPVATWLGQTGRLAHGVPLDRGPVRADDPDGPGVRAVDARATRPRPGAASCSSSATARPC